MTRNSDLLAAIDAGGTTFKCAVATPNGDLVQSCRVPTTRPDDTIQACVDFFRAVVDLEEKQISALGIGSFGPLDIDPASPGHGTILQTPKPGWSHKPIKARFAKALGIPVHINTDVNAALAGEMEAGAAKDCQKAAYITVGTGIGAGVSLDGALVGAPLHPEFGHIRVKRHIDDLDFPGVCPFHGDCVEGVASATAFEARYGDPRALSAEHAGWRIEADYLAQACLSLATVFRLERIILGGGLMQAPHLIGLIRETFEALNAGYLPMSKSQIDQLIVTPKFGDDAGLMGAFHLARQI